MVKKKIMVIDDEEDFLKITKMNLEATGDYEVIIMSNAKDMLNQVHGFRPDLILLDLLMPSVGGMEACQMLNDDSLGKGIPIIILSAIDKDQDKLQAYKLGVVDYLSKPIDRDGLIAKIKKALEFK